MPVNTLTQPLPDVSTTTQRQHDIPLDHLDYRYVEKCDDVKELEKIYKVLVSGVEGKYPDLEKFIEEKIKTLSPNSRVLRKDTPIMPKNAMPSELKQSIEDDMNEFVNSMPSIEKSLQDQNMAEVSTTYYYDERLPPVRTASAPIVINSAKKPTNGTAAKEQPPSKPASTKSAKPRDYREWEKIEKKLDKNEDDEEVAKPQQQATKATDLNGVKKPRVLPTEIPDCESMSQQMRVLKADQEKTKGNEALNAKSYDEALAYYTRSIQLLPSAAAYNNRALTYFKLENWDRVIEDCNKVVGIESDNFKAYLRRATANLRKKRLAEAKNDIDKCMTLDKADPKARDLVKEIQQKIEQDKNERDQVKSIGGNRLQIEETDGSEDEDAVAPKATAEEDLSPPPSAKKHQMEAQKRTIPIAEVESDDDDDDDGDNDAAASPVKEEEEEAIELPQHIVELKDKANNLFSNGQYGDAVETYTRTIKHLRSELDSSETQRSNKQKEYLTSTLSILYNNRASSYQKICDYKSCISDCNLAIELIEQRPGCGDTSLLLKLIWKKANSYEMIEKFKEAFSEYERLMKLDSKFKDVQQSYNRLKKLISETSPPPKTAASNPAAPKLAASKPAPLSKEPTPPSNNYEDFKNKGNDCVKQSQFDKASECYTRCIELDASNTVAYLNRAHCYIRLGKPLEAIRDCTFVLERDKSNVKALYRRAVGYKQQGELDSALRDLDSLFRLEPSNTMAKKEFDDIVKMKKPSPQQQAKKVLIEEVSNKSNAQQPAPSQQQPAKNKTPQAPAPSVTPTLKSSTSQSFSNIETAYQFLQAWNSIDPNDSMGYANLIAAVKATELSNLIGSKLDGDMLTRLIAGFHLLSKNNKVNVIDYLLALTKAKRFDIIKMFMHDHVKQMLREIFANCGNSNNESLIKSLEKKYDM